MRQFGDVRMPKGGYAVLVRLFPMDLLSVLVSLLGVLQCLAGLLLPGLVILFLMGFRGASMGVGGAFVQLGSSLMILVMRSVIITSGHL
jgi:hypothetical protein